jgi:hypothetical protein
VRRDSVLKVASRTITWPTLFCWEKMRAEGGSLWKARVQLRGLVGIRGVQARLQTVTKIGTTINDPCACLAASRVKCCATASAVEPMFLWAGAGWSPASPHWTTVIAIEQYNDHVYVQLNALYMQAWQPLSGPEQRFYSNTVWLLSHAFQAKASFQRGNTIGNTSGV